MHTTESQKQLDRNKAEHAPQNVSTAHTPEDILATPPPTPRLNAATILTFQRIQGNRAITRSIQNQVQRTNKVPRTSVANWIQRYDEKDIADVTGSLKLPEDEVRQILEIGEATGLFPEVRQVAVSKKILNPDGFAKMLGSLRAVSAKKDAPQKNPLQLEDAQPTATKQGDGKGFTRELLYGLEQIQKGCFVQFGAMKPDDLYNALMEVGLKGEAEHVKQASNGLILGDQFGGDIVTWGNKSKGDKQVADTIQHKVVEGKDDRALANEIRDAIHQLAGRNGEFALQNTQRIVDIVVMPTNRMSDATVGDIIDVIQSRMNDTFGKMRLEQCVDLVRVVTNKYHIEYATKDHFVEVKEIGNSITKQLDEKTPKFWNQDNIKAPKTLKLADNPVQLNVAPPQKKIDEMTSSELRFAMQALNEEKNNSLKKLLKELNELKNSLTGERLIWMQSKVAEKNPELLKEANKKALDQAVGKRTKELIEEWPRKKELDAIQNKIGEITKDEEEKYKKSIKPHQDQQALLQKMENVSKDRVAWIKKNANDSLPEEQQKAWAKFATEEDLNLYKKLIEYKKQNAASIESHKEVKAVRNEMYESNKQRVEPICHKLNEIVVNITNSKDNPLIDTIIKVVDQSRHMAGIARLCDQLAEQLFRAFTFSHNGAILLEDLQKFTTTLCKHADYNNLQGDLAEITDAVLTANSTQDTRKKPVRIGREDLDPRAKDPENKEKLQEVDISYEDTKGTLHMREVAWDINMLTKKLLLSGGESQRTGYARVIEEEKRGRKVTMTYVVHQAVPEGLDTIVTKSAPTKSAPTKSVLSSDAEEPKPSKSKTLADALVENDYSLLMNGKTYSPSDIKAHKAPKSTEEQKN